MARSRILIDTSILIDHIRKQRKDQTVFYRYLSNYDYAMSVITEFEFRVGMTSKNHEFGERLLAAIPILPLNEDCISAAVKIHSQLRTTNQLLPIADILIAATAVTHKFPLLTFNRKHFARIIDLNLHSLE